MRNRPCLRRAVAWSRSAWRRLRALRRGGGDGKESGGSGTGSAGTPLGGTRTGSKRLEMPWEDQKTDESSTAPAASTVEINARRRRCFWMSSDGMRPHARRTHATPRACRLHDSARTQPSQMQGPTRRCVPRWLVRRRAWGKGNLAQEGKITNPHKHIRTMIHVLAIAVCARSAHPPRTSPLGSRSRLGPTVRLWGG